MKNIWTIVAAVVVVVAVIGGVGYMQSTDRTPAVAVGGPSGKPASAPQSPSLAVTADDYVYGKADAPITIIEYASLTCPHCAAFHRDTLPKIKAEWIDTGKAKLVYRNFPFDQPALRGASLAACAPRDRYFSYLDVMFSQQNVWAHGGDPLAALGRIAKLGGMSDDQFQACMKNEELANKIVAIRMTAEKELEVNSTPTFFINGRKISGALDYAKFDEALKAAAPKS